MLRRLGPFLAAAAAATVLCAPAGAARPRVAIFYYPWYGNPAVDGAYQHWQQRNYVLPGQLASAFYPVRGLYSSSDAAVVAAQMREIRRAGVDQVVTSWWGRGSPEDLRLPLVLEQARTVGLSVGVHLEPYEGRTTASTADDVRHLTGLGLRDFYVYGAHDAPAEEWAQVTASMAGARVLAQTARVGFAVAGGFSGVYTYDVLVYGGRTFGRLCEQARKRSLLCAPSVGPGYDARRAVADLRVKPRRDGATYDAMWRAALAAAPDVVTITSYNEWHEGTQIEPAMQRRGPRGGIYLGYDGAWGRHGPAARTAYLDRTAHWTRIVRSSVQRAR